MVPSLRAHFTQLLDWRRHPARPRALDGTLEGAAGGPGRVTAWWATRRPTLYPRPCDGALARFRARYPEHAEAILRRGLEVLEHRFDLLGSGSVTVADAGRSAHANGYRPIDWHVDPRTGGRFPADTVPEAWSPSLAPVRSDVKWPWELGRCQHWPLLAQCGLLAGDARFLREVAAEFEDFDEAAPPGRGVQWICAMDVGIRAANWALAFEWARDGLGVDHPVWPRALSRLWDHGVFVAGHLENGFEVTSNHYLSDLVGLLFVGRFFSRLRQAREWEEFARRELEKEIRVQLLPDGADYESSVPYHRFVAELLLSSAHLMALSGAPPSTGFRAALSKAVDFHEAVLRPDGRLPVVGDADDGRLHVLEGYGGPPQAGRHLLGPAASVLGEPRWLAAGGDEARREAFWWGFEGAVEEGGEEPRPSRVSRLFPDAGLAVCRDAGDFLLVTNGRVGTNGFGNHKHNDQLSFELHAGGEPFVVDPGSYVYTPDPDARNAFRGTAMHSSVSVDGAEQNGLRPNWLFRLEERARAEHVRFEARADGLEYHGRHHGFAPVVHERHVRLRRPGPTLEVVDRLRGPGTHRLRWHIHFAPDVRVSPARPGVLRLEARTQERELHFDPRWVPRVEESWCAPSYGVRAPCLAVDFDETVDLAAGIERSFTIAPLSTENRP